MDEKSNLVLIREYFNEPKCSMQELKALTPEDKQELGDLIRAL